MSLSVSNSEISGITVCVPKRRIKISNLKKDLKDFIKHTGVKSIYSDSRLNTSELCISASKKLINGLKWKKSSIGFIIFVSQTRDHILPQTSCKIQESLNLDKKILTLDIPMGCSGFVNGLYLSFLLSVNLKKNGLLLCGDVVSKLIDKKQEKMKYLFGDSGSAIGIKYNAKNKNKNYFNFGTDGSGSKHLIYQSSGINFFLTNNFLKMDGAKIFEFALNKVPTQVEDILRESKNNIKDINYVIFHQANKFLLKTLSEKIGFKKNNVLYSIHKYGNTNSASIPITMFENYNKLKNKKILISGFGVGLTWSSGIIDFGRLKYKKLIKYFK
tara:strand:- start:1180 stop:2166 length:987 start_codon:yes stop_codon:yes gene_type:complete